MKRAAEIVITMLLLPFLLPLLVLIGIAVRLDSRGPILFRHQRIGYRGYLFTMYKFRSMAHQQPRADAPRLAAMTRDGESKVDGAPEISAAL